MYPGNLASGSQNENMRSIGVDSFMMVKLMKIRLGCVQCLLSEWFGWLLLAQSRFNLGLQIVEQIYRPYTTKVVII